MGGTVRTAVQLPEAPASVRRSASLLGQAVVGRHAFRAFGARPEREAHAVIENRPTGDSSTLLEAGGHRPRGASEPIRGAAGRRSSRPLAMQG